MAVFFSKLVNAADLVTYHFRFQINGTSDPNFIVPGLCGISDITRGAAGSFNVYFVEKHPHFVSLSGSLLQSGDAAAGDALIISPKSYTASTGVLIVRTIDPDAAGAPAAADPDDDSWVCLSVTFCRRDSLGTSTGVAL